jgi:hypothetical protein
MLLRNAFRRERATPAEVHWVYAELVIYLGPDKLTAEIALLTLQGDGGHCTLTFDREDTFPTVDRLPTELEPAG